MKNKLTALFLGRFQPAPHRGHVEVVKTILVQHNKLIIALGSAQYARTPENFATIEERIKVWREILEDLAVPTERFQILPVTDTNDNCTYVDHVVATLPPFSVVYSGNQLVLRLFDEAGFKTTPLTRRYLNISNSKIRKMIVDDKDLSSLLPGPSLRFLQQHGLISD